MARVTVEDCIDKVENKFELVVLAAQRSKSIASGVPITVEAEGDKDAVIALREIANENVKPSILKEEVIRRLQTRTKLEDIEEDDVTVTDDSQENADCDYVIDGVEFLEGGLADSYSEIFEDNPEIQAEDL